jgi:hypothetical protein
METISSLKPNVSREDAVLEFQRKGVTAQVRSRFRGPLRSVALVHIPFRLFRVHISNHGTHDLRWFALDAVTGTFDPYMFDAELVPESLVHVTTRNHPKVAMPREEAERLLTEKVRRLVFASGFFRIRDFSIQAQAVPLEFHVPYWIGFFGSGPVARFAVIDAVRRCFEGPKVRSFFYDWLRQ